MSKLGWWIVALGALGCGDDGGSGMDQPVAGGGGAVVGDVGFDSTVMPLILEACNCHQTEPVLMAPFSLKLGEAYDNLVNVPAMQLPTMSLITPGSLNDSYLWHKINDTQLEVGGQGLIMPSNIPLNQEQIDVFGRWIAAGAPR